jgi:hypothetical protein
MQRFIAILFCLLVTEPAFAATSVQDLQQLISQQRYATATPNGEQVMQLLSTWLADWESLDHERYRSITSAIAVTTRASSSMPTGATSRAGSTATRHGSTSSTAGSTYSTTPAKKT